MYPTCIIVLCTISVIIANGQPTGIQEPNKDDFRSWEHDNGKQYTHTEERNRYSIYVSNSKTVQRLNSASRYAVFGLNKFADLSEREFEDLYLHGVASNAAVHSFRTDNQTDTGGRLSTSGPVNLSYMLPAVKDPGHCGSCWAFSAVGNMEAQTYQRNGGHVVSLSEQQLVSCEKIDHACNGGWMTNADAYALRTGMVSTASMPYTSTYGVVSRCPSRLPAIAARYRSAVNFGKVAADMMLMSYMSSYGPLSLALSAGTSYFQYYRSGIMNNASMCGRTLNHAVVLVGYGTASNVNYWLLRNSWGRSWGEAGYFRLARGIDMCGMNDAVSTIVA